MCCIGEQGISEMKVDKVVNNNLVRSRDNTDREIMVVG